MAVDDAGLPLEGEASTVLPREIGVLRDVSGNGVAFQGSVNESATAWTRNFESFSVYASWDGSGFFQLLGRQVRGALGRDLRVSVSTRCPTQFASAWSASPRMSSPASTIPKSPRRRRRRRGGPLPVGLPHSLRSAPPSEDTAGVGLFPHQRQVVERLAGLYPRSWLVADEVGLGKTITAGMALRRLAFPVA